MSRDMTLKQFNAALAKHGMQRTGFMGYVKLGVGGVEVSILNAGNRRRDWLAYLLAEKREVEKRIEREAKATKCKYGDKLCPCQDGDMCHYEGPNAMTPPTPGLTGFNKRE